MIFEESGLLSEHNCTIHGRSIRYKEVNTYSLENII